MLTHTRHLLPTLCLTMTLAACAAGPSNNAVSDANDPDEGFNRKMFAVEQSLDKWVVEPVAKG